MPAAIVPPSTPPSTLPPLPRRRFADDTEIPNDVYVLRTRNETYLAGYGDTPVVSDLRRPNFLATYLVAMLVCGLLVTTLNAREEGDAEARLARDGVEVQGTVTTVTYISTGRVGRSTLRRVDFAFAAPARGWQVETTYHGIGFTRDLSVSEALLPGTPLTVRYVRDSPDIAQVVVPPLERGTTTLQERQGVLILAIPLLCYPPRLAVWWWLHRHERQLIRDGVLLRAEVVGVRREHGVFRTWNTLTYRFRTPDGEWITAQTRVEYARNVKAEAKAAVLYLNRRRFALL